MARLPLRKLPVKSEPEPGEFHHEIRFNFSLPSGSICYQIGIFTCPRANTSLSSKIMKDPRTRNSLGFAFTAVIAAVAFSMAQPADRTGTLTAPLSIPMMMDGKQIGSSTAPAGTKVKILQEDGGKVLVATAAGQAWTTGVTVDEAETLPETGNFTSTLTPEIMDALLKGTKAATTALAELGADPDVVTTEETTEESKDAAASSWRTIAIQTGCQKSCQAGANATSAENTPGEWMTDYNSALAAAGKEKKPALLFFTGSDWCHFCVELEKNVLSTDEFKTYAKENLILVKLDFPKAGGQPAALRSQNQSLASQYQIKGYPTLVLLDPSGAESARIRSRETAALISEIDAAGEKTTGYGTRTVTYKNKCTGEIRVVKYDADGNVVSDTNSKETAQPESAGGTTKWRISSQSIQTQLKNAKPNTFYIEPGNYQTLKLIAGMGNEANAPEKQLLFLSVPTKAQFKVANYRGGLKAWHVTEIPKKTTAKTITVRFDYQIREFAPESRTAAIQTDPAFKLRNGQIIPATNNLNFKDVTGCGTWIPAEETFNIPEDATHFILRPGFSGADKGIFFLRNLEVKVGERDWGTTASFQGLPSGNESVPSSNPSFEKEVLELVNTARKQANLPALQWKESLAKAGRYHAADMAADGYFSHDSKDRVNKSLAVVGTPFERIGRFDKSGNAENIAYNQPTPEKVMSDWMNSPGHRANILSKNVRTLGVGYVDGYWVQDFGG